MKVKRKPLRYRIGILCIIIYHRGGYHFWKKIKKLFIWEADAC